MIYAGLDISNTSTALTIDDGDVNFFNYTIVKKNNKWIKDVSDIINFRFIKYQKLDNFSDLLIQKIKDYDSITDLIVNDLLSFDRDILIGIEGYNYGLKRTDSIIDISEFSSILKMKLSRKFDNVFILPPKTVKIKTCKMVYNIIDKKKIVRNHSGIPGGSFDKKDMFNSLIEGNFDNKLRNYLLNKKDDILKMKNIPKPFDDIIDSFFIMQIIKNNFNI